MLVDVPRLEIVQYKTNILYFDDCLGPYPYEELSKWNGLSSLLTSMDHCKLYKNVILVISHSFFILDNLILRLCPETKLIRSAMELFPTSVKENTKKRRKWGPIRSETDVGYEHLPNLVPKEENKIR